MMPLLRIDNLSVTYSGKKSFQALRGVSFEVQKGEILGLVGESGSGKTTLVYSILNILPQDTKKEGKVLFEGKDIYGLNGRELNALRGKELGVVFQEPAACFNPVFTVGYQFREFLQQKTTIKDTQPIMEQYLKVAGLPQVSRVLRSYPHQLSGGQLQRAMIAMAISTFPKLLIADEPTSSLDVTVESQVINLLLKLRDELNLTILFITHNLGLIDVLCERVVVLHEGQVKEQTTKEALFNSPKDSYTVSLINSFRKIEA